MPSRVRLAEPRLWLGICLIAVSVIAGARILTDDDETVTVMRASRDLSVGSPAVDLVPEQASRALVGDRYLDSVPPSGSLRRPVAAGELIPRSALGPAVDADVREVTLAVDPLHAPPGVQPGDIVDVWVVARRSAGESIVADSATAEPPPAVLVLEGVPVAAVAVDDLGVTGDIAVVLAVPTGSVRDVVEALRRGEIDLVSVPIGSQYGNGTTDST